MKFKEEIFYYIHKVEVVRQRLLYYFCCYYCYASTQQLRPDSLFYCGWKINYQPHSRHRTNTEGIRGLRPSTITPLHLLNSLLAAPFYFLQTQSFSISVLLFLPHSSNSISLFLKFPKDCLYSYRTYFLLLTNTSPYTHTIYYITRAILFLLITFAKFISTKYQQLLFFKVKL